MAFFPSCRVAGSYRSYRLRLPPAPNLTGKILVGRRNGLNQYFLNSFLGQVGRRASFLILEFAVALPDFFLVVAGGEPDFAAVKTAAVATEYLCRKDA